MQNNFCKMLSASKLPIQQLFSTNVSLSYGQSYQHHLDIPVIKRLQGQ